MNKDKNIIQICFNTPLLLEFMFSSKVNMLNAITGPRLFVKSNIPLFKLYQLICIWYLIKGKLCIQVQFRSFKKEKLCVLRIQSHVMMAHTV